MTNEVVPIRPDLEATSALTSPSSPSPMLAALDQVEHAAAEAGVLYVDVELQLALARHLVAVSSAIVVGAEPTVAQVHALRELRLVTTELRAIVLAHARARR